MIACTLLLAILSSSSVLLANAKVIVPCPVSETQEVSPQLQQLCYAIEQALTENNSREPSGISDNRNINTKRQDVDHIFLRFGRPFGL